MEGRLEELLSGLQCRVLGFYWPFKGEFDARPLARRLIKRGVAVALPAVVERKGPLEFRLWRPRAPMERGAYDIPVPRERNLVRPDHLLIPAVGFDEAGYRLGYGGGYYDRTLAVLTPRPFAIGVGFEIARLETVYPQVHDVPLDVIVTEARTLIVKPSGERGTTSQGRRLG